MNKSTRMGVLVAAAILQMAAFADTAALPPPCDPVPVKKPVKVVKREISVAIIGVGRPSMPANRKPTLEACFSHWKKAMDREIQNRPDLVVLPEGVDSWAGASRAEQRDWELRRGDRLLKAFQEYARAHKCYLVFNSHRQRSDGRFANSTFTLDRDGDVIGVYDKVYPMTSEIEWKELPIVPGEGPVAVEADFGRLVFATCFDLNFRDLIVANAALKPDLIVFCSAYNGDFWQRTWSLTCRSHLVACTTGMLAKDVAGPAGEVLFHLHDYFKTATVKINTNCKVCHLDFNWEKLQKAVEKYGPRVTVRNPGAVGCVTLLSNDPELKAEDVVKEFEIEELEDYYQRSVRARGGPLKVKCQ